MGFHRRLMAVRLAVLAVAAGLASGQNYPKPIRSPATEDFDCTPPSSPPIAPGGPSRPAPAATTKSPS